MRARTFLLLVVIALAAALAACGGDVMPGAQAASVAAPDAPALLPAFDAKGFLLRSHQTDHVICEPAKGAAVDAAPAFDGDGRLLRCPETGLPLYSAERGGEVVLVRDPAR